MKKVLFRITNNLNIGGVQRRIFDVLKELKNDYECHVVVYKEEGILADKFIKEGIHVHYVPMGSFDLSGIKTLSNLFKNYKADIVHTHSYGGTIRGVLAAKLAGVRKIFSHIHVNMGNHWYGKWRINKKKKEFIEKLLHKEYVDKIFFVSDAIKKEYLHGMNFKNLNEKSVVLYNGFNLEKIKIKKNNMIGGVFNIGIACRLSKDKNLLFIVEVIEKLIEYVQNIKFHFIGDGSYKKYLVKEIAKRSLNNYFIFHGMVENVYDKIKDLDLVLMPSYNEGLPASIIEPLLANIPVIAVDNEINREILNIDKGGWVLQNSYEVFVEKILQLYEKYDYLYQNMTFNKYKEVFSMENHINQLRYYYES
ncbi:glycosyltransferase [Deferribacter thermophilus]|uniref:glycosyltransferase n=1 Tax=Deferribacter thermophilus TaxID=53573 RepID=UPI003C257C3D